MIKFDNFESALEVVLHNSAKMDIFANYFEILPANITEGTAMKQLLNGLKSPDEVMFAVDYHDLTELQKPIVTAALKTLITTDNWEDFKTKMDMALSVITKKSQQ